MQGTQREPLHLCPDAHIRPGALSSQWLPGLFGTRICFESALQEMRMDIHMREPPSDSLMLETPLHIHNTLRPAFVAYSSVGELILHHTTLPTLAARPPTICPWASPPTI